MEVAPAQRAEASRTAFAAVASLAPFYALLALKTRFRLDQLHIGLFQALIFMIFRWVVNLTPVKRAAPQVLAAPGELDAKVDEKRAEPASKKRRLKKKTQDPKTSQAKLDDTLYRFLTIVDPETTKLMPPLAPGSPKAPAPLPLTEWKQLHQVPEQGLIVYAHPSISMLYAISTFFPEDSGVPFRNLWELLVDVSNRPGWDGMCEKTEQLQPVGPRDVPERTTQRQASVAWLGMIGMWPVKAKDLVLISVIAELPEKEGRQRLVCATTSTEHDNKPPGGSYERMQIGISGFIVEEDEFEGKKGIRLTQLTDLSGLGKWIPGKVLSVVTQTMIPKSLRKIGKAAKEYELPENRKNLQGDAWRPPLLGKFTDWPDAGGEEEVEEEEDEPVALASETRSISELVRQLRVVTARLAQLEGSKTPATQASRTWLSRLWPSSTTQTGLRTGGGDLATASTSVSEMLGLGAVSGVVSAAAVVGIALLYGRQSART